MSSTVKVLYLRFLALQQNAANSDFELSVSALASFEFVKLGHIRIWISASYTFRISACGSWFNSLFHSHLDTVSTCGTAVTAAEAAVAYELLKAARRSRVGTRTSHNTCGVSLRKGGKERKT